MIKVYETVENEIITALKIGLPLLGYSLDNPKDYVVRKLAKVVQDKNNDLFSKNSYRLGKGGVYVFYSGEKNTTSLKANFADMSEYEFTIIPFIKNVNLSNFDELNNFSSDVKGIIWKTKFLGKTKLKFKQSITNPTPSKSDDSIYFGWLSFSLKNFYYGE